MKLMTRFELAAKNTSELYGLYRAVFNELATSQPGTTEHTNALASLKNIEHEIAAKMPDV